jgi:hypothetical protein
MEEIKINKEWITGLCKIVDELALALDEETISTEAHGWISHLIGYTHSLDEYLKITKRTPEE